MILLKKSEKLLSISIPSDINRKIEKVAKSSGLSIEETVSIFLSTGVSNLDGRANGDGVFFDTGVSNPVAQNAAA